MEKHFVVKKAWGGYPGAHVRQGRKAGSDYRYSRKKIPSTVGTVGDMTSILFNEKTDLTIALHRAMYDGVLVPQVILDAYNAMLAFVGEPCAAESESAQPDGN